MSHETEPTFKERHLNDAVAQWRARGWQLSSISGDYATLTRPPRNGCLHFALEALGVLISFGLSLIFILYRWVHPTVDTVVLKVDNFGNVHQVSWTSGA